MLLISVWFITMLQMDPVVDELLKYNPCCWRDAQCRDGKCAVALAAKHSIQFRDIVVKLACYNHTLLKYYAASLMGENVIDDDTVSNALT